MRFRPDDGYCKPACGDRHNTVGFLLRVRVKKSRIGQTETAATETVVESTSTSPKASTSRIGDCDTSIVDCSTGTSVKAGSNVDNAAGDIPSTSTNVDKTLEKEQSASHSTLASHKNVTFSQDADYELPRLKIMGRVETEFKFMSMTINWIIIKHLYFLVSCIYMVSHVYLLLLFRSMRLSVCTHDTEQIRPKEVGVHIQHDISNWHSALLLVEE